MEAVQFLSGIGGALDYCVGWLQSRNLARSIANGLRYS